MAAGVLAVSRRRPPGIGDSVRVVTVTHQLRYLQILILPAAKFYLVVVGAIRN